MPHDDSNNTAVPDEMMPHDEHAVDDAAAPDVEDAEAVELTGPTPEEVEELVAFARGGDAELPVGAEDFAIALAAVADQRDETRDLLLRTAADLKNSHHRAQKRAEESRDLARVGVVQSLLQVLDFFDLALQQNPDTATAQQVLGGVEMIKGEFVRVLQGQGVTVVSPSPGDEFDPTRHEAIEHAPADGVEPGTIAASRSPGYHIGDRVVRPAKVAVASDPAADAAPPSDTAADGDA